MSAIFIKNIVPKVEKASFSDAELKAVIQILELMNATDNSVYKKALSNNNLKEVQADFSSKVSQHIYFHPELYKDEAAGLQLVASWLPLIENGFYPDKKSILKLLDFLYFNLTYFQSSETSEVIKAQIFQVLQILVQSKSEASLAVARFLVERIFDIRDVLNSDFLIQNCIKYDILNDSYTVVNQDQTISTHPFQIDDNFVLYFFENDWYHFITSFHQILPVGRIGSLTAYDLMRPWFSNELALFYKNNTESSLYAINALKDRLIFTEAKSLELLNIKNSDNFYPLIHFIGNKVWDAGDVLLFNNRDKNIPQNQLDNCYLKFLDWLSVDGGSNFNTEAFKNHGIKILSENTAEALPLQCILFWFNKCHPKAGQRHQIEVYNTLLGNLLLDQQTDKLPIMRFQNEAFQVTGAFLINDVFQTSENFKGWLQDFVKLGMINPLNQFLVRTFNDAKEELLNLYNAEQQEFLQLYLLEMAHSARDTSDEITKQNLPLIVKSLTILCFESGNFTRVNEIWGLKNIDDCVKRPCNDFAKSHYINENRPLNLNIIQAWFNYLGDFYYSSKKEAIWIADAFSMQGVLAANYFNAHDDNVSFFIDRAINHITTFHKKCKHREAENQIAGEIAALIELFLSDFLGALNAENLNTNTVQFLKKYSQNDTSSLVHQTRLLPIIDKLYQHHFKDVLKEETNVFIKHHITNTVAIETVSINPEYVDILLQNLENYSAEGICDIKILEVFNRDIVAFKSFLKQDDTGIETRFTQALYMTLLDINLAPGTTLENYGTLSKSLFVHLVKGTKMAGSYAMGLKAMIKSGVYPENVATVLSQVVEDLKS
ncbi:MAG: hypothetical protein KKH44_07390 [Bacteroidetes bacterium]|nr:hypothetical protein [Bacteroidota bacterium]